MNATAGLGVVCTALSVSFVWPQVIKIYRRNTVEGLAPFGTLHGLVACTLWTMYGASRGVAPLVVSNAAIGAAMLMIAAAQIRHRSLTVTRLVAVLAAAVVVGAAGLAVSSTLVGWVAIVVGVTAIVPQTVHVSRVATLTGVSLPMYLLVILSSLLWSAYGLLVEDYLVIITNVLILPCALFVAVKAWRSQYGVAPLAAIELP